MPQPTGLPSVFLGSSTEGLPYARKIRDALSSVASVDVWDTAFNVGTLTLEVILGYAQRSDFGIFVISPDDAVRIRGVQYQTVRDNVLFEAGVFMGSLGRERTLLLWPKGQKLRQRLPSDILGLTTVEYQHAGPGKEASLERACQRICQHVGTMGRAYRSGYNEILALRSALDERELEFTDGSLVSYLEIVRRAARRRQRPWFSTTDVRTLLQFVRDQYDAHDKNQTTADNTFWWLIILGVVAFNNIDTWTDGGWNWDDCVDRSAFTPRGVVLLNELRGGR